MKQFFYAISLILLVASAARSETVAGNGAWCWFADPRALHYENADNSINATWVGFIDIHGAIKAVQYDFITQRRTEVLVRSCFQPDDHDNPTFLVLPDERVMVFYSRHTDEPCFYYRVSQVPGDITTLGNEHRIQTDHNTTYPSPFLMSCDPEHFYLCWRGINWHPTIARLSLPDSDDEVTFDQGPFQIVQSTGARPYAKYFSNGSNLIMMAYTTGHPDDELPNWLYFSCIDISDMSLHSIRGEMLCCLSEGPFQIDKSDKFASLHSDVVVDASPCRDWVWQASSDNSGNPMIAMTRISADKSTHEYCIARWDGEQWKIRTLADAGGWFHQSPSIEHCYSAGMAIGSTSSVYCSRPADGVYEIVKYELDDLGEIVSVEAITAGSEKNNIRPFCIPGAGNSPLRLAWMRGDYYDWIVSKERPQGYPTVIVCGFDGFSDEAARVMEKPEEFSIGNDFDFTFHVNVNEAGSGGVLVDLGDLKYCLDSSSQLPEVRLGDKSYRSINRLATSDSWQQADRRTDGLWYEPVALDSFELRLAYSGGWLSTFINGSLDQRVFLPAE